MTDENKIRDVLIQLDNLCPLCRNGKLSTAFVHNHPEKTEICSKHLLDGYNDLENMITSCVNCLKIIEEVKSRGLNVRSVMQ